MRLAHLSDLHFGRHDQEVAAGLAADIALQHPDLAVISGDFTQLGTRREFEAARDFLDRLTVPFFAVPGNHDVPALHIGRRLFDPYGLYRRYIDAELEPFVETGGVAMAGIRSTRRARPGIDWAQGLISRGQLRRLAKRFALAAAESIRVVVVHHPLLLPTGPMQKPQRRVDNADAALRAFADLGVRLVLSGHFHRSYVRRFGGMGEGIDQLPTTGGPMLIAQAASTTSTRLRGEPNAYNVVDIVDGAIRIAVREWRGAEWFTRVQLTDAGDADAP